MIDCSKPSPMENDTPVTSRIVVAVFAILVWFAQTALVPGQTFPRENTQTPVNTGTPLPTPSASPTATSIVTQSTAGQAETQVLYGLQGVLVETLDGQTVAMQ